MSRDTGLADRLRATGLAVVEVDGWRERGSSDFAPRGSVHHHTAGGPSGETPSLNTCINGRPDLAGPLCNTYQSRDSSGWDVVYVVAAGRANHAGSGGWRGLSGNSSVYGLEVEHTGIEPVPQLRVDISAIIHAAMLDGIDPGYCSQHREWAEGRKVDFATNVDGDDFRDRVANAGKPAPDDEDEKEDDVPAPPIVKDPNDYEWWLIEADGRTHITTRSWAHSLWWAGVARVAEFGKGQPDDLVPFAWTREQIEAVPIKDR